MKSTSRKPHFCEQGNLTLKVTVIGQKLAGYDCVLQPDLLQTYPREVACKSLLVCAISRILSETDFATNYGLLGF